MTNGIYGTDRVPGGGGWGCGMGDGRDKDIIRI